MIDDHYALLVVDMQNGFCHPAGSFPRIGRGLEGAMDAVANAAVAVGQARRAGVPVVFTRHVYRPGRPDEGAALIGNSPELAGVSGLAAGGWAFMRDFPVTLLADCCAAKTRRLHDLSLEVLSSYELAEIATVTGGFDAGDPLGAGAGCRLRSWRRPSRRPWGRLSRLA